MLRLRLKSSSCCSGLVFETDCETEVVCVLGLEVGADRALQMAQWTRRTKRTGLNENRQSQAEMEALSQERDADVGWREK